MKYYLHDSNAFHDEKIYKLYMEYGYEGLGLFYTFLEKIAQQEKPMNEIVLKKQLNIGKRLEKVWAFMKEIELISVKNGDCFNENLLNFAETYEIKKEKTRKRVAEFRERQRDKKNVTGYKRVSNAPKVKLSKVKESKIKERELEFANDVKKNITKYPNEMLEDFIRYWTEPNRSGTKMRFEMQPTFEISRRLITWSNREKGRRGSSRPQNDPKYV